MLKISSDNSYVFPLFLKVFQLMSTLVESTSGWDLPLLMENHNYRL